MTQTFLIYGGSTMEEARVSRLVLLQCDDVEEIAAYMKDNGVLWVRIDDAESGLPLAFIQATGKPFSKFTPLQIIRAIVVAIMIIWLCLKFS